MRGLQFCWPLLAACLLALQAGAAEEAASDRAAILWNVDRTDRLGEHKASAIGHPRVVKAEGGSAVEFDGKQDALFIEANPLADLAQFTVEVVFRPYADGPKEQRFLHFQEAGSEDRLLFETRLTADGRWFLDTFIKSGDADCTLLAKEFTHPIGPWYHAAVVVDGKSMRHYVNGKEELRADVAHTPLGQGQTSLGVRINKVHWFKGAVRQIRITPRALAASELLTLTAPRSDPQPAFAATPVRALADSGLDERLDLVYATYGQRQLHLDLFRPASRGDAPLPAVLVVHGGGWLQGDKTRFRALAQALASRGYVAAAIEYRLGGEAKFPAAVHDCHAAVRWLRANARQYGIDPERIAAVGGSAGGHLAGLLAAAPDSAELQGSGGNPGQSSRVQAAVIMAGPMDLSAGPVAERSRKEPGQSNANRWFGKTIDEAPELYKLASPLTHLSKSTPPMLFMHGELDHPEQNRAARQRLKELGVPAGLLVYAGGKHGCWSQHPWFEPMVDDIDAFLSSAFEREVRPEWFPTSQTDWGTIRMAADRIVFDIQRRPAEGIVRIPRLNNPVRAIYANAEASKSPLKLTPGVREWSIELPATPNSSGTAEVTVETVGRPHFPAIPRIVCPPSEGTLALHAHDAVVHGELLRYEPQPHKNTIGYWTNPDDWCGWQCYIERPGRYEVRILQGCGKGQGGSEVVVQIGKQTLEFIVEDTGHFQNFKERSLGTVELTAQVYSLEIRARRKAAAAVMDVREVRLAPVASDQPASP